MNYNLLQKKQVVNLKNNRLLLFFLFVVNTVEFY